MPYADPEQKRAYMVHYNSEYYEAKKDTILPRVSKNKERLRREKKEWCIHACQGKCFYCNQRNPDYLLVRSMSKTLLPTPVCDRNWNEIKTYVNQIEIICTVCDRDRRMKQT